MSEYKKSYYTMFNAATQAIDAIERGFNNAAKEILKEAQQKAEEEFISYQDKK